MKNGFYAAAFIITSLASSAHAQMWGQTPTAARAQTKAQLIEQRRVELERRRQERAQAIEQRRLAMEQRLAQQRAVYEQQKLAREQARLARAQAKQQGYANQGFETSYNTSYGTSGVQPGSACNPRETNPIKCKVCAIYGEDHGSREGMHAVAGVIETRKQSGKWGSDVCRIVYAPGQFIGAYRRLPNNPALIANMVMAAQNAGANGYMGFRSYCRPGRNHRIGPRGNCYGKADASQYIELDPTMTAEDVDAEAAINVQFAEAYSDSDEG